MTDDRVVNDSQDDTEIQTIAVEDEKAVGSLWMFQNMLGKPAFVHAF